MLTLNLPFAPSVNDYYGRAQHHVYLKAAGRAYRRAVKEALLRIDPEALAPYALAQVAVRVIKNDPLGKTEQDSDNGNKALLDALTHAGLWKDDKQVRALLNMIGEPVLNGSLTVTVSLLQNTAVYFEEVAA